ncbi:acetyltransferase [Candidatus Electronema sp. PJ]|uniref:DHHA1 domain-containing protein n=1 Tax=Candidatus Electronema sp. PJ TaxID=3401572 RepID=UPI003AA8166D
MKSCIDVFNGDADGICALHQLRLAQPQPAARLVSGVKRDIELLQQIEEVSDSSITVLDISLDKNRASLSKILAKGNQVFYADHHYAGEVPVSEQLTVHIDPEPLLCTSLIINWLLEDRYALWAVVGAFGDNLDEAAKLLAQKLEVSEEELAQLREVGILLNYNGYGAAIEDLFFHPAELYRHVQPYASPLVFHAEAQVLRTLREGYRDDMDKALATKPLYEDATGRVFQLPAAAWARRVSGVCANAFANQRPDQAHALLTENSDGSLLVSVRAPLRNRNGADLLCRQFPTGGGRAAAAGINVLPAEQLDSFIQAFIQQFGPQSAS